MCSKKTLFIFLILFTCSILLTRIFISNQTKNQIVLSSPRENFSPTDNFKTGFIKYFREKEGTTIVFMDNIEFYMNEDAKREYLKDNKEISQIEWGNDYYYRNIEKNIIPYELSKDVKIYICNFAINPSTSSVELVPISVDTLKEYVNNSKKQKLDERAFLFNFQLKNNKIIKLEMQYTP